MREKHYNVTSLVCRLYYGQQKLEHIEEVVNNVCLGTVGSSDQLMPTRLFCIQQATVSVVGRLPDHDLTIWKIGISWSDFFVQKFLGCYFLGCRK